MNKKYFSRGEDFTVYTNEVDMFNKKEQIADVIAYLDHQDFIMKGSIRENWFAEFTAYKAIYSDAAVFWSDLWAWLQGAGAKYKPKIQWTNPACDGVTCTDEQKQQGIAHSKLFKASLKEIEDGKERFEVYFTMRQDITDLYSPNDEGMKMFPYAQSFLYWEEVGIIDSELVRNLIIAFSIILAIIAMLIPQPRIFIIVALNIMAAIVEVIGFSHYMGVTMNGVSTIYFLICA